MESKRSPVVASWSWLGACLLLAQPALAAPPPAPMVMYGLPLGTSAAHAALDEALRAQRAKAEQERKTLLPAPAPPVQKTPLQQALHAAHPANAAPSPMPSVESFGGKDACAPSCCCCGRSSGKKAAYRTQCRCQTGPLKCPSCMSAMYC